VHGERAEDAVSNLIVLLAVLVLVLYGGFLFAPYVAGIAAYHLLAKNWGRLVAWSCILIVLGLLMALAYSLSSPTLSFSSVAWNHPQPESWMMLGQMVLWGVLFSVARVGQPGGGWRTVGLVALAVSFLIASIGALNYAAIILVLVIILAIGGMVIRRMRRPAAEDLSPREVSDRQRAWDLGCMPYPSAESAEEAITSEQGAAFPAVSCKLRFRTSDPGNMVLDFYANSARSAGLRVQKGQRITGDSATPMVPGFLAMGDTKEALVLSRDIQDEFVWTVTAWLKTWPEFYSDMQAGFIFETVSPDGPSTE
jgi:hypothetical protein